MEYLDRKKESPQAATDTYDDVAPKALKSTQARQGSARDIGHLKIAGQGYAGATPIEGGSLMPDSGTIDRFLAHCHRRRYKARTDIFRPGDPAETLYYVVSGSVSVLTPNEDDEREMVLGYYGKGEFIGGMGLFAHNTQREVILRTRTASVLAEINLSRFHELLLTRMSGDATRLVYAIGAQMSQRLRSSNRKIGRLVFLDARSRILDALRELAQEPEAMTHPDGILIKVSRFELSRLVGCSREVAGRVLKKLMAEGLLHAHGKSIVLFGNR